MYDEDMKETAEERQNKIFRKMSAAKKIKIVDDFFKFAKVLKKDDNNSKIYRKNKFNLRTT